MKLHNYENFINEAKQLKHKYGFRDGDVVIATTDINADDLDFKRTAKSWIGRNLVATHNLHKSEGNFFKKGDVLMISVNKDNVYVGGKSGPDDDSPNGIASFTINPNYDEDFRNQMIQIALNDGRAEIIKYDDLDEELRKNFEVQVMYNKAWDAVRKDNCTIEMDGEDLEILSMDYVTKRFKLPNDKLKIDVVKNKQKESYYISYKEFTSYVFKENGKVLSGDPFDGFTSTYAPGGYRKGKADGFIQH